MTPFGSDAGDRFLRELSCGVAVSELEAMLDADTGQDLELSQEQYVLAVALTEAGDPGSDFLEVQTAARALVPHAAALYFAAHECMNRLLGDPSALLWHGPQDGGIGIRREARTLRARLHRLVVELRPDDATSREIR